MVQTGVSVVSRTRMYLEAIRVSAISEDVEYAPFYRYTENWKYDAERGRAAPTFPTEYALFCHVMVF